MRRAHRRTGGGFPIYQGAYLLRLFAELSKSSHEPWHLHFMETSEVGVVNHRTGQGELA